MDHFEDVIADQKDIDSAMARSINTDFDEEELENELSLLVTAQELDRATSPKSVSDTKSPVTLKEDEEAVTISDEDLLSRLEALKLAKPKPSPQLPVPEEKEDEPAVPELAM